MGTSGYQPSDSDDAWDGFAGLIDVSRSVLLPSLNLSRGKPKTKLVFQQYGGLSGYRWAKIGVVELFMRHGGSLPCSTFRSMATWLDAIAADDAWLDQWRQSKLIRRSVAAYRALFRALSKPYLTTRRRRGRPGRVRCAQVYGGPQWPRPGKRRLIYGGVLGLGPHVQAYADFDKEMRAILRATRWRSCTPTRAKKE